MTATVERSQELGLRQMRKSVDFSLETFNLLLGSLEAEDRTALREMLCDFCQTGDQELRHDITDAIQELLDLRDDGSECRSMSIDEWMDSEPDVKDAVIALTKKKKKFSATLAQLRAERGLTQEKLAQKLKVTQPTIAALEKGEHKPQPKTLKKLAEALGVSIEKLWPPEETG